MTISAPARELPRAGATPAGTTVAERPTAAPSFSVAHTLRDVVDCWKVIYRAYVQTGLIEPNAFGMHTAFQALEPDTAIAIGRAGHTAVSTATAMLDGAAGLPLDFVYKQELDQLRRQGRRVVEIGLLADYRMDGAEGSSHDIFEPLRIAFHFARFIGGTDIICGMPPRRAKLYGRLFGFEVIGSPRTYSAVKDHPVILMRGQINEMVANCAKYRAIDSFMKNPVPDEFFETRYRFDDQPFEDLMLNEYIKGLHRKRIAIQSRCA